LEVNTDTSIHKRTIVSIENDIDFSESVYKSFTPPNKNGYYIQIKGNKHYFKNIKLYTSEGDF
jgi:hypothetical protein